VIAYLDCVGGLAGDMLLAALLDAGAPKQALRGVPNRLGLERVELRLERVQRHGIGALRVDVMSDPDHHPHRSWRSIREQLLAADLGERVRDRSIAVFARLADAEAAIHGVSPEEIHFHELGAVDTLVDIVGAVTLLEELGITRLVCAPLPMGRGMIRAAHGMLPLPAPATVALLMGAPIYGVDVEAELVTPTGAALASTLAGGWGPAPGMTLRRIGYGTGSLELAERPNLLRVLIGDQAGSEGARHEVVLLETNLDDLSPELVPDAIDRCFAAGALDVWTVPIGMKKGRPGIVLSALARPEGEDAVARTILEETTALGVRVAQLRRYELEREERTVEVDGRRVRVKLGRLDGRLVNVAPEHDDCAALARATGVPIKWVWTAALAAARQLT
jgi:pyridinium-3,5-bisthiocarboxylic acid mononucleotide nickel chelatase